MAGPQFLSPHPASASRPRRRFSLEQANATLPLVKRIVTDIVRSHQEVSRRQMELDQAAPKAQSAVQAQLQVSLEHLQDYVDELLDIGCELKDYNIGLVDFICRHKGRDICLCWKLGEESIGFWHETNAGANGRQPVATLSEPTAQVEPQA